MAVPTVTSASIAANGLTLTINFSEAVYGVFDDLPEFGFYIKVGVENISLTYVSGNTTATAIFTTSRIIINGETVVLDYTGSSTASVSTDDYLDIFSDFSVTNNSTVTLSHLELWTPSRIATLWWLDASDSSTLFDATSGGSLVAADGEVARWEDKSGNAKHITQATSVNRPIRKTNTENGRDVVQFDGTNDVLDSSAIIPGQACFIVAKRSATAQPVIQITTPTQWYRGIWGNAYSLYTTYVKSSINGAALSSAHPAAAVTNTALVYQEDRQFSDTVVHRVGFGTPAYEHLNGHICEVIMLDSIPNSELRSRIEGYLAHKWGLIGALPSDHPYKNTVPLYGYELKSALKNVPSVATRNNYNGVLGHEFTLERPMTIVALGRPVSTIFNQSHQVNLWRVSNTSLIKSVTVSTSSLRYKGYAIEQFNEVELISGVVYRIASTEYTSGDNWADKLVFPSGTYDSNTFSNIRTVYGSTVDAYPNLYDSVFDASHAWPNMYENVFPNKKFISVIGIGIV
jgi:hypothetical protein